MTVARKLGVPVGRFPARRLDEAGMNPFEGLLDRVESEEQLFVLR